MTTVKRPAVSAEVFARKLYSANGKLTAQQCANELGMSIESFNQRLIKLRQLARASGTIGSFPKLLDARKGRVRTGGKTANQSALDIIARLQRESRDEVESVPELELAESVANME